MRSLFIKFYFIILLGISASFTGCLEAPGGENSDSASTTKGTKSATITISSTSLEADFRSGISENTDGDYLLSTQSVDTATKIVLTLFNTGDVPAEKIKAHSLSDSLSYAGGSYPGTGGTCSTKITPQSSCTIVVNFTFLKMGVNTSTLQLGYFNGKVTNKFEKIFKGTATSSPSITQLSPTEGPIAGGGTITITGNQIYNGVLVSVGGKTCTVTSNSEPTSVSCTLPAHAPASTDIVVTNTDGKSVTYSGGYTYQLAPGVTGASLSFGPLAGGSSITISGSNFKSGAIVVIGNNLCTSVAVSSSSSLSCVTPAHSAGSVDISVTNSDGQTGSATNAFTYIVPPTVSSISPSSGALAGGSTVTISGSGFMSGATATIGGVACTSPSVLSSTSMSCITGAHAAAVTDVIVTNADTQSGTGSNLFTYQAAPAVSSVTPTGGALAGGTSITISGTGFLSGATVLIGGTTCTSINVVSSTSITCTTPSNTAGTVNITVTNTDSQFGTGNNLYTYRAAPTVTSLSPSAGALAGGTTVTVTGTGFISGATVSVGGSTCTSPSVTSATAISCTLPASTAGAKTVTVTNSDNQLGSLASAYTYQAAPTVSSVSLNAGALAGGTTITVTGTGFVSGATVTVGGVACTSPNVTSSTTLTCITGAHAAGATSIIVTNSDSQSGTGSNLYTYQAAPTVTAISENTGPTAGGTYFTITGTGFLTGVSAAIGGNSCNFVTRVSSTSLTCFAPAHSAGVKDVTVSNADTQSATLSNAFTYSVDTVASSTGFYGRTVFRVKGNYAAVPTCTANGVAAAVTDKGNNWYQLSGLTANTIYNVSCTSAAGSGRVTARTLASSETFMNQGDLTYNSTSLTAEHCMKWSRKMIYNQVTGDIVIESSGSTGSFSGGGYSCVFVYTGYHWYPILLGQDSSTSGHGYQTGGGIVSLSNGTLFVSTETWASATGWSIRMSKCTGSCYNSANWSSITLPFGSGGIGSSLAVSQDESKLVVTRTTNFAVHLCTLSSGCDDTTDWTDVSFGVGSGNAQGFTHFDVNGGMWVAAPSFSSSFLWYCPNGSNCTSTSDYSGGKLISSQTGEVTGLGTGLFNLGNKIIMVGHEVPNGKWAYAECDPTSLSCGSVTGGVFTNFSTTEETKPTGTSSISSDGYTTGPWLGILSNGYSLVFLDSSNSNKVSRKTCINTWDNCKSIANANWNGGAANWGATKVNSKGDIVANFTKGAFVDANDEQVMIGGGWDSLKTGVISYFD